MKRTYFKLIVNRCQSGQDCTGAAQIRIKSNFQIVVVLSVSKAVSGLSACLWSADRCWLRSAWSPLLVCEKLVYFATK